VWLRLCAMESLSEEQVQSTWEGALDKVILQKVLPKINGSKRTLLDSLKATAAFLEGANGAESGPAKYVGPDGTTISIASTGALTLSSDQALKASVAKLKRMNSQLSSTGHASYIL